MMHNIYGFLFHRCIYDAVIHNGWLYPRTAMFVESIELKLLDTCNSSKRSEKKKLYLVDSAAHFHSLSSAFISESGVVE